MTRPANGLVTDGSGVVRCAWCTGDPLYQAYHDSEWGLPVTDDRRLFEKICLEGFQAGLSWLTILRKRENFRRAFHGFDIPTVAAMGRRDVTRLMRDEGIIRHRGKIESSINNANRALEIAGEFGSLASYVWQYEPASSQRPRRIDWRFLAANPVSPHSTAMSKDLKKRGWTFVGPTTMHALMQAAGLVNDHLTGCAFRMAPQRARDRLGALGAADVGR